MSQHERISLMEGERVAAQFISLVAAHVDRIEVAGSVRRQRADVADIEIVCVPRFEAVQNGLFADMTEPVDQLDTFLRGIRERFGDEELCSRPDKNGRPAWGPKYKRLLWRNEWAIDLFAVTPPAQWGPIFTIRTGPWEFSKALVTKKAFGGLCPNWAKHDQGRYIEESTGKEIQTPEERDVFRFLGLDWIAPNQRCRL